MAARIEPGLHDCYESCRRLHRRRDPTYYWATRRLPHEVRPAVHALYALVREVDDVVDAPSRVPTAARRRAVLLWEERLHRVRRRWIERRVRQREDVVHDSGPVFAAGQRPRIRRFGNDNVLAVPRGEIAEVAGQVRERAVPERVVGQPDQVEVDTVLLQVVKEIGRSVRLAAGVDMDHDGGSPGRSGFLRALDSGPQQIGESRPVFVAVPVNLQATGSHS